MRQSNPTHLQQVYERVIRNQAGVLFAVRFTVTHVDGAPRAHIISITPVTTARATHTPATALISGHTSATIVQTTKSLYTVDTVSPYVSLDFFMSQPTRAPSQCI